MKTLCVFCSSSDAVGSIYSSVARELGALIAKKDYRLIYGGCHVGLMGKVAIAVKTNGGKVTGIIPQVIHDRALAYKDCDELIVTKDLRERKALMQEKSDAFITLPGSFGTLEESLELITLKQLGLHNKPIVFINTNDFYKPLLELFEQLYQQKFVKEEYRELYYLANTPADALDYLRSYRPKEFEINKWSSGNNS